jgi:hypothetical protein
MDEMPFSYWPESNTHPRGHHLASSFVRSSWKNIKILGDEV